MADSMSMDNADALVAFKRDGAACLRGVFKYWVQVIAEGIEQNMREPGPLASNSVRADQPGRFFDDYCNWPRIPQFKQTIFDSPAARLAAYFMESETAQFFHEHVLVKEPGTKKSTPWHSDIPYYFVYGRQTISFWIPVDPVKESTLQLIAGSHRRDR